MPKFLYRTRGPITLEAELAETLKGIADCFEEAHKDTIVSR